MPNRSSTQSIASAEVNGIYCHSSDWGDTRLPLFGLPKVKKKMHISSISANGTEDRELLDARSCTACREKAKTAMLSLRRPGDHRPKQPESRARLKPFRSSEHDRVFKPEVRRRAFSEAPTQASRGLSPRRSAPDVRETSRSAHLAGCLSESQPLGAFRGYGETVAGTRTAADSLAPTSPRSSNSPKPDSSSQKSSSTAEGLADPEIRKELDARWILNLSLAFRDKSDQEKFFVTYAEQPNRWRRLTVSCDYSNAPEDSLEADLKSLRYQRDKSAHIYEAIRESLSTVQFYDTVTNLRLETADNRLHVHVTEDVNEIIKYPPLSSVQHLRLNDREQITEESLHFVSHISGFVYQVDTGGDSYIKKEIPGPDMVDEFLYEVNALCKLRESTNVIKFRAIVLDTSRRNIKGLLISFARKGALVDLIYDHRITPLSWPRRDKWVRQIVIGLSEIHEAGFVQGDFTLSNIVIDDSDDAKIIDINRRGCPVGWEPPEFLGLIASGQRISMYIGTKSDLYQLGMVLWALSVPDDEPERAESPLSVEDAMSAGAPTYLRHWMKSCLSENPTDRRSASELLADLSIQQQAPGFDVNANALVRQMSSTNGAYELPVNDIPFARGTPGMSSGSHEQDLKAASLRHSQQQSELQNEAAHPDERRFLGRDIGRAPINESSISGMHAVEEPESFTALDVGNSTIPQRQTMSPIRQMRHSNSPCHPLSLPFHQDSGFGPGEDQGSGGLQGMIPTWRPTRALVSAEHELDGGAKDGYVSRQDFSPPMHQDSGFDESVLSRPAGDPPRHQGIGGLARTATTDEFAGIGAAHAEHREDRSIYVA